MSEPAVMAQIVTQPFGNRLGHQCQTTNGRSLEVIG